MESEILNKKRKAFNTYKQVCDELIIAPLLRKNKLVADRQLSLDVYNHEVNRMKEQSDTFLQDISESERNYDATGNFGKER